MSEGRLARLRRSSARHSLARRRSIFLSDKHKSCYRFWMSPKTIPTRLPEGGGLVERPLERRSGESPVVAQTTSKDRFEEHTCLSLEPYRRETVDRIAAGSSANTRPTAEQKNLVGFPEAIGGDKKRTRTLWNRSFRDQERWRDDLSLSSVCEGGAALPTLRPFRRLTYRQRQREASILARRGSSVFSIFARPLPERPSS